MSPVSVAMTAASSGESGTDVGVEDGRRRRHVGLCLKDPPL